VANWLRFFLLIALGVWVGAILFFAVVLAPTVFRVLPTRELAGNVVNPALRQLHAMGFVCGAAALASLLLLEGITPRRATRPLRWAALLTVLMMALTALSQFAVSPRMERLRSSMGVIDSVPHNDERRVSFNKLHQWSTGLEGAVLLLGIGAVWFAVKREAAS
jgi:hypothetical protein